MSLVPALLGSLTANWLFCHRRMSSKTQEMLSPGSLDEVLKQKEVPSREPAMALLILPACRVGWDTLRGQDPHLTYFCNTCLLCATLALAFSRSLIQCVEQN